MNVLLLMLSPVEYFYDPIEGLSLDKVEGNVLSMPLNDGRRIEDVDIVQFLGIDPHDLEPLRFLAETVHSGERPLHFVRIGQHLLHEDVVLLHLPLPDVLRLQVDEGVCHSRTSTALLVPVEAADSAALVVASGAGVLVERLSADGAQLLPLCVFGEDELRGLLVFADLLALLQRFVF